MFVGSFFLYIVGYRFAHMKKDEKYVEKNGQGDKEGYEKGSAP